MTTHEYPVSLSWAGSTANYDNYSRNHEVQIGEAGFRLSADPAFKGDPSLANPENLLVAAASSCQMLSFLAVSARSGVEVIVYSDEALGIMPEDDLPVRITRITLKPSITVRTIKNSHQATVSRVERLIDKAHQSCYIANSLSSEIVIEASIDVVD